MERALTSTVRTRGNGGAARPAAPRPTGPRVSRGNGASAPADRGDRPRRPRRRCGQAVSPARWPRPPGRRRTGRCPRWWRGPRRPLVSPRQVGDLVGDGPAFRRGGGSPLLGVQGATGHRGCHLPGRSAASVEPAVVPGVGTGAPSVCVVSHRRYASDTKQALVTVLPMG